LRLKWNKNWDWNGNIRDVTKILACFFGTWKRDALLTKYLVNQPFFQGLDTKNTIHIFQNVQVIWNKMVPLLIFLERWPSTKWYVTFEASFWTSFQKSPTILFRVTHSENKQWYTRKDTIFWHNFQYPFTWCGPFCCEC